ncbi:hypothetical protein EUGRSUZ_A01671 [Eucalyptus grandis]|uniref:Uncharacterized protein n=2 Tax=Eucalyptus grandis TaxID=71139 RepID=A0ACC3M2Q5_EUCGR|nr:hypothetical protein EUGRSUZ_A01671 [Eucalyptus grandis]
MHGQYTEPRYLLSLACLLESQSRSQDPKCIKWSRLYEKLLAVRITTVIQIIGFNGIRIPQMILEIQTCLGIDCFRREKDKSRPQSSQPNTHFLLEAYF